MMKWHEKKIKQLPLALWALLYLQLIEPTESGFGSAWAERGHIKALHLRMERAHLTKRYLGKVLMVQVTSAFTPIYSCHRECQPWEQLPLHCWQEPRAAGSPGTWSPSGQGNVNQVGAQTCDCISSHFLVKPFSLAQRHLLFSHQLTPAQQVLTLLIRSLPS